MGDARASRPPSRAGRPAAGESTATRERLLAACWDLLLGSSDGGPPPTVAAVCAAVGCTPPTLYHHFGNLAELRRAACAAGFARWSASLEAAIRPDDAPRDRLAQRGAAYLAWGIANPAAYRVLFLERSETPADHPAPGPGFEPLLVDLGRLLGLDPADPRVAVAALAHWSAVHGLTCLALTNPELPAATLDLVLAQLTASLAGADPQPRAPEGS